MKNKKLYIVALIMALVGGIMMLVAAIKVNFQLSQLNGDKNWQQKSDSFAPNVGKIAIDLDLADVILQPTEEKEIRAEYYESDETDYTFDIKNETLTIGIINSRKWWVPSFGTPDKTNKFVLFIPEDCIVDLDIITDLGSVEITDLTFKNVTVESDLGTIRTKDIIVEKDISLEVDLGDIRFERVDFASDATLKTDNGKIYAKMLLAKEEYNIEVDTDLGHANIENQDLGKERTVEAKTSLGNIDFEFSK